MNTQLPDPTHLPSTGPPVVSVVMPVYNYERYVAAAIESVLAQRFDAWELIVVDDHSTDRTPEIVGTYAGHPRLRVLRNERNLGQFPTHQRGAELAIGRYLKFFHADDVMYPHCLQTMVDCMEAHPEAVLGISCDSWPWVAPALLTPNAAWRAYAFGKNNPLIHGPSATIFRTQYFRGTSGFDSRYHSADVKMNLSVAMTEPVLLIPAGLFWYRRHDQQVLAFMESNDVGYWEYAHWFPGLLDDPRNPLSASDTAAARQNTAVDLSRYCLHLVLRGRLRRARALWKKSGYPWRSFQLHAPRWDGDLTQSTEDLSLRRDSQATCRTIDATPGRRSPVSSPGVAAAPLVSVLVPAYNAETTIAAAVESVLAQSITDWELIIVDDASTDRTAKVCKSFAERGNIHVHVNDRNLGKWANHNRCVQYASGKYLKFLHADDLLQPNCLEVMTRAAEANPSAALVQSHEACPYLVPRLQSPLEAYRQEYFGSVNLWESPTGTLYRRDAWRAAGGLDPTVPSAQAKLNLELCRKAPALLVYAGLAFYRRDSKQRRHLATDYSEYCAADLEWLNAILNHRECPLDAAERAMASRNLRAIRRNLSLRALLIGDGMLALTLRRRLVPPHSYGDEYWRKYHAVAGLAGSSQEESRDREPASVGISQRHTALTPTPAHAGSGTGEGAILLHRPPASAAHEHAVVQYGEPAPTFTGAAARNGRKPTLAGVSLGQAIMSLRQRVFEGVHSSGIARMLAAARAQDVCYFVLSYHGISERPQPLFTSARTFERHLHFYQEWGRTASMTELRDVLDGRTVPDGPKLRFVLTFDDGYANVVHNAVPLLRKYGARAIIYVIPDWIDRGEIPWWFQVAGLTPRARQARQLLKAQGFNPYSRDDADTDTLPGKLIDDVVSRIPQDDFERWWDQTSSELPAVTNGELSEFRLATWAELQWATDVLDVGSHTASHCIVGLCCNPAFVRQQILSAKQAIERHLGQPCAHFAYPRGEAADYNEQTQHMLIEAGHETAVTMHKAVALRGENPLTIPRFYVGETPVAELAAEFAGIADRWDRSVGWVRDKIKPPRHQVHQGG